MAFAQGNTSLFLAFGNGPLNLARATSLEFADAETEPKIGKGIKKIWNTGLDFRFYHYSSNYNSESVDFDGKNIESQTKYQRKWAANGHFYWWCRWNDDWRSNPHKIWS